MSWLIIRNFGRVKYFNLSYFVILGVPLLAEVFKAIHPSLEKLDISSTFPANFKLLYAASLCYAVAIAVYQYCCPEIIKQYENEEEYVSASQDIYERAHPDRKVEIVLANLIESQEELRNDIVKLNTKSQSENAKDKRQRKENLENSLKEVYPSCVQRFLFNEFQLAKGKYPLAIFVAGLLYVAGTLILLYLLALKTINVFSA